MTTAPDWLDGEECLTLFFRLAYEDDWGSPVNTGDIAREELRAAIRKHFVPREPLERLILEQENDKHCFYQEDIAHEASYAQDRLRELHKLIRES